ncbi:MAG: DUF6452 family protein [Thermonemataceae bacterium]
MKKKVFFWGITIWLCLMQLACVETEDICGGAVAQNITLRFQQRFTVPDQFGRDSVFFTDTLVYIQGVALGGTDSVFLQGDSGRVFSNQIPFNSNSDTTELTIATGDNEGGNQQEDRLALTYARDAQVINPECGLRTNIVGITLITPQEALNSFDSVVISTITGDNAALDIYYYR